MLKTLGLYLAGGALLAFLLMHWSGEIADLSAVAGEREQRIAQLESTLLAKDKQHRQTLDQLRASEALNDTLLREGDQAARLSAERAASLQNQIRELQRENTEFKNWADTRHPAAARRLFNSALASDGGEGNLATSAAAGNPDPGLHAGIALPGGDQRRTTGGGDGNARANERLQPHQPAPVPRLARGAPDTTPKRAQE